MTSTSQLPGRGGQVPTVAADQGARRRCAASGRRAQIGDRGALLLASATATARAAPPAPSTVARVPVSAIRPAQRREEPFDVGVGAEPAAVADDERVDRADAPAPAASTSSTRRQHVDLERRRDARARAGQRRVAKATKSATSRASSGT